ncbi:MAG: hybrid sensor histidine kinase/response regulator [Burkholderiales bacterium]|nr:hybrid sensor histidine kinase/response regulator [Burkholderiales bacterium]
MKAGAPDRRRVPREVDHLRALAVQTPASLAGNAVGLVLLGAIFWPWADRRAMLAWLGCGGSLWLLRLAHHWRYRNAAEHDDDAALHGWRKGWRALVVAQGAMWGVAVWLFWGLGEPYHRLALLLVVYSYCLGAVQLLAGQWRLFLALAGIVLLPAIVRVASDASQPWHWQMAGVMLLLFVLALVMGRTAGTALRQAIELKTRTDEIAMQLRIGKAEAEAARRAAEAASQAKTQFFAAASHDLRQPLHAMGLFAEALRQRSRDPEVASLVHSINESVDALEGLFGELLDITRIDTGAVEVRAEPLRLRELFARLRLHFEPLAFEKGLQLTLRGGDRVVRADPVLLERILRNLVSNALRYTDDGGVLVGARARGERVLLQVWDSGIGIAEASLPHIFDEFYQVQGPRPLAPQQRKGLGLGLAIVKRLAALMEAPLAVRSRVGHGSVLELELPAGKVTRSLDAPAAGIRAPIGLALDGRLVLVVEDEAAVREGLVVLLQAWGADVLAFEAVDAVQAWLAEPPPRAPDLLLVDYRLPDGHTGIDALALVRAHWSGSTLPAVVITGSTMGGHEAQAEQHDYHLLTKPVLPARLRAMIAYKLGLRQGSQAAD